MTVEDVEELLQAANLWPVPGYLLTQGEGGGVYVAWHEGCDQVFQERRLEMAAAVLETVGLLAERDTDAHGSLVLEVHRRPDLVNLPDPEAATARIERFLAARGPQRHNTISTAGRGRYTAPRLRVDDLQALLLNGRELEQRVNELEELEELGAEAVAEKMWERARLRNLEIRGGKFDLDLTQVDELASAYFAFARIVIGDAENYSESAEPSVSFDVKIAESPETFVLIVQRVGPGKLTPHEARMRAEERVQQLEQELAHERAYIDALTEPTEWGTAGVEWAAATPGGSLVMPFAEGPARDYVADHPGAVLLRREHTAWHRAEPNEVDEQ